MSTPDVIPRKLGSIVIAGMVAAGLSNVESDPILYHGVEPDDCCPPIGGAARVVVWWKSIGAAGKVGCGNGGTPMTIGVRVLACWPAPTNGIVVPGTEETTFGATAAWLMQTAWVGQASLERALGMCDDRRATRTLVSDELGVRDPSLGAATPRLPRGGCAGVDWTITVTPFGTDVAGWLEPAP